MKTCRLPLVLAATLAASAAGGGGLLERWHWRNPLPQGNALYNVVFVNGHYLALGELGTILTSNDGTNWVSRETASVMNLRDCSYGAGMYVVVGDFGTVLTSTDARTWTPQNAGTFYSLNGVDFANHQFVCVGERTSILTSTDGTLWLPRSSGPWTLSDVIYAGGLYLAAGGTEAAVNSAGVRVILTSNDAQFWTTRVLAYGQPFHSLAYGEGAFAATTGADPWYGLAALWSSTNGIDWQPNPTPTSPSYGATVTHGEGTWVLAFGNANYYWWPGEILISDDMVGWDSAFTNSGSVSGVCHGGGKFVAARLDGAFLLSTDGGTWSNPWPDLGNLPLNDLAYLNGQFVGLNFERFVFSSNGIQWASAPAPTNTGNLFNITYGEGLYVAGGESRMVWISTDGLNWTNPATNLSSYPYSADVVVAYGNGLFVGAAGYQGDILTSDDGVNWTVQPLVTNENDYAYWRGIAFDNGRFVAVAANGIATSTDGTNWFTTRTNAPLDRVVGGGGKFVAVGHNTIAASSDGTNWSAQTSSDFGYLSDVAYGAGWFVATTGVSSSNPTLVKQPRPIWVSPDGNHWSRRTLGTSQGTGPIAFGNGTFVTGTQNGGLLQSDPVVTLNLKTATFPELQILGPRNHTYRIESLDSLSQPSWSVLATTTATNEITQFTDTTWTNSMVRFYRAVLLP